MGLCSTTDDGTRAERRDAKTRMQANKFSRSALLLMNVGFMVIGGVILAASAFLYWADDGGETFDTLLLLVGSCLLALSVTGYLGATRYNNLLFLYFIILLVTVVLASVASAVVYQNQNLYAQQMKALAKGNWKVFLEEEMPLDVRTKFHKAHPGCESYSAECWERVEVEIDRLWYGFISQFLAVVAALLVLALYFSERVLGMSLIVKKLMNINHFLTLVMGLLLLGLGLAMVQGTEAEFNGAAGGFMLALGATLTAMSVWGQLATASASQSKSKRAQSKLAGVRRAYTVMLLVTTVVMVAVAAHTTYKKDHLMEHAAKRLSSDRHALVKAAIIKKMKVAGDELTNFSCKKVNRDECVERAGHASLIDAHLDSHKVVCGADSDCVNSLYMYNCKCKAGTRNAGRLVWYANYRMTEDKQNAAAGSCQDPKYIKPVGPTQGRRVLRQDATDPNGAAVDPPDMMNRTESHEAAAIVQKQCEIWEINDDTLLAEVALSIDTARYFSIGMAAMCSMQIVGLLYLQCSKSRDDFELQEEREGLTAHDGDNEP